MRGAVVAGVVPDGERPSPDVGARSQPVARTTTATIAAEKRARRLAPLVRKPPLSSMSPPCQAVYRRPSRPSAATIQSKMRVLGTVPRTTSDPAPMP